MNDGLPEKYSVNFFELEKPENLSKFYQKLEESELKFYYFKADKKRFLLVYGDKSKSRNGILESIKIVKEINKKKQVFRGLRGYFLMALEIRSAAHKLEDLKTNLGDLYWENLESAIRKKQKNCLRKFLYDKNESIRLETLHERVLSQHAQLKSKYRILAAHYSHLENNYKILEARTAQLEMRVENLESENFKNLEDISWEEMKEIVKRAHEINDKVTFKDFYGGDGKFSLFDWKGFKMKYNTIRKTDLYKKLNEKFR